MHLQPEQLEQMGYELHARLDHTALLDFVRPYFFRRNVVMLGYHLFCLLLVGVVIYAMAVGPLPLLKAVGYFLLGMVLFLPVIPLHEWIHGLGYQLAGARSVQYKAVWRQLVFYAMADRFVTTARVFYLLALAPFVVINTAAVLAAVLLPMGWNWLAMGLLVMHTLGCSGDFALMSYFREFRHRAPVTYDEVDRQVSWFYLKKQ